MLNTSNDNSIPSRHWFVHNWESENFFPTQTAAISQAISDLEYCQDPDDGSWTDYVEDIYVGYVTHQVKHSSDGYSLRSTLDNERIIATVLAALRYFQANRDDILDLDLPHFIDNEPLANDEIDNLCEAICLGEHQLSIEH
jgi:hypothetical protein